ncbi:hypothetical protein LAZ67_13001588 [Cordylochernes scorpioides]|uniref:Uncharacterized protein n=1 Tax=Cordylochernes scorpioides TaxID=51811 RepID=A0ABY6L7X6_9ARAC|nr:hypothetical protein LAZ67_13001588 [Cordylochernes scorpioides]
MPLCIFFELLNISRVNYKLLFDGNQPQNFYKRRKDFLKALSLELVTEYHHIRSTTKSFHNHFEVLSENMLEEDIPEPLSKAQKRCHLCSYKKDRKTKTLCQKCQKNLLFDEFKGQNFQEFSSKELLKNFLKYENVKKLPIFQYVVHKMFQYVHQMDV